MPPPLTVSTSALLGRDDELESLLAHAGVSAPAGGPARVDAGPDGGRAVLLGGDAGLGKTRLLVELADRARSAGWRVLVGHCLDMADLLLPYLPFSELVGRFADEEPERARDVVGLHPAVAALAPGRRLLVGAERPRAADDHLDRAELFEHVHAAFEELATDRPLLVILEDLHWADQSTRDLLTLLLTRSFRGPVCLIGSYRSDDLNRRHPLRAALGAWARLPGVLRHQLAPLPDPAVRGLVRALHPGLLERQVAEVVARAEGNPFFAGELVAAALQSRSAGAPALPETLADVLLVRLDALDDATRQVVRAAACSGRRVTHDALAAVVDLPDAGLEQALRTAVEANVLARVGADGYAFRHALLAEAVHDDLLPGERVRLHGRYVAALAGGTVAGTAAELATHARAAHDHATAVAASIRAGEDALAVGGPDDAATHFQAALELVSRPGSTVPDGVDVPLLVRRASEALTASGQPGRAVALVRDHLDAHGAELDAPTRARLLVALAAAALLNESSDEPIDVTSEAVELAGPEASRLRAQALSVHARALTNAGRFDEAAPVAGEAAALAQVLGMSEVAADATTTLADLDVQSGDHESALQALERVATEARAAGDIEGETRGRYHLALIHLERGRLEEAAAAFHDSAAAAAEAGRPWAPYGYSARYHEAMTLYLLGRWDEATRVADFSGETPPGDPEALLCSVQMLVGAGRGDRGVLRHYDTWRGAWGREGLVALNTGAAALDLLGADHDVEGLWRVHDEVTASLASLWSPRFQGRIRLAAVLFGRLADAVAAGTPLTPDSVARAADVAATVDDIARRAEARPRGFGAEGRAWVLRARAEHGWLCHRSGGRGHLDELVSQWRDAVAAFDAFGHPYEAARSRLRLAELLTARREQAEAGRLAEEARRTARSLGARPLLDAAPEPATQKAADKGAALLTPREQEVLELVAEGCTNGEVAQRLFISTKTVSVHVSNLLAKLGAGSRTEAVALARRRGLLG
ncbi:ATP-binding protein [Nocardioides caldifontis]|uniref:ATP-binding protein n=1 Tax=Nocardioides caldifontis TaxID=2588938 RepID=UPI001396CE4D|nr:helix-turn-helix transcriptional regulator [Nocardioides caldifontis]